MKQNPKCRQAIDTSAVIPLLLAVFCFTTSGLSIFIYSSLTISIGIIGLKIVYFRIDTMAAQMVKVLCVLIDANQEYSKTAFQVAYVQNI